MEEHQNIELRSEEVREFLSAPPRWLVRWGTLVVFSIIFVLFLFSWFYKYPDLIRARATVLTENPPVTIYARATGKLDHLFVSDQQEVDEGQLLGIIENPADYNDVYALKAHLDSLLPFFEKPVGLQNVTVPADYQLGEVHPYYTAFLTQLTEYVTSNQYNLFAEKVLSMKRQATDIERYLLQLTNQARILDDKLEISRRQLSRDSALFRKNAISETDLEKSRSEYLNNELNHRTAIANLANTRMLKSQIERQMAEFSTQKSEQHNLLLSLTREKYENLQNQLLVWEQAFVLKSPLRGKVTFNNNVWKENQQVAEGTPVCSVVPLTENRIIGRIVLPVAGSGKVTDGQRVNIKLDNFPHLEYGMLRGRISNISLVPVATPDGGYYTAEVIFDEGLKTNYGKELQFSQEMQGEAEIITVERRLIQRLVAPLVSQYRQRMLTN